MATINQVRRGIEKYMDAEILPKLPKAKAFGMGVYAELLLSQTESQLQKYLELPAVKVLGIVDESGNIDIEKLRDIARKRMPDSMQLDLPLIGTFTFRDADIDLLYQHIMGAMV